MCVYYCVLYYDFVFVVIKIQNHEFSFSLKYVCTLWFFVKDFKKINCNLRMELTIHTVDTLNEHMLNSSPI